MLKRYLKYIKKIDLVNIIYSKNMKLEEIQFKEIKKINGSYISRAYYQNNNISFNVRHLSLNKTLYKKNNRVYLNVSFDKTENAIQVFNKLKNYTINHILEQHKEQGATLEQMTERYINNIQETETEYIVRLEVNLRCDFIQRNQFDDNKSITHKDISVNDDINISIVFNGILYGKSNFTNNFTITKLTKHIEEMVIFEEDKCYIQCESDEEMTNDVDELANGLSSMCINIDEIPEF